MKGRGSRMGRYKVNAIRVKKAKQKHAIIRRYAYEANHQPRNNMMPRQRVHVKRSIITVNMRYVLIGLTLLFAYVWTLYKLFRLI